MDLLSHRARTGISVATTGGILAVCVGAMALGKNQIWTGSVTRKHHSHEFLTMAKASSVGESCGACHTDWSAPDAQCMACHTNAQAGSEPGSSRVTPVANAKPAAKRTGNLLLHNPVLVARNAHQGKPPTYEQAKKQKEKPVPTQGVRVAWSGHPRLPLACGSCHREHAEDGVLLEKVSNTMCEACHPKQHRTMTSIHQTKEFLAKHPQKDKNAFEAVALDNWHSSCLACHFEHGDLKSPGKPGDGYDVDQ